MGWMFTNQPLHESEKEYLARHVLSWANLPPEDRPEPVACSQVGSVFYFAVRSPASHVAARPEAYASYIPDVDGSVTWAAVILTSRAGGFGYKDMTEDMGPYESNCPPSLIRKLSGLRLRPDGTECYAQAWRNRCLANAAVKSSKSKLREGQTVTLAKPVTFSDGLTLQKFVVTRARVSRRGVSTVFRSVDNGGLYRIRAANLAGAVVE